MVLKNQSFSPKKLKIFKTYFFNIKTRVEFHFFANIYVSWTHFEVWPSGLVDWPRLIKIHILNNFSLNYKYIKVVSYIFYKDICYNILQKSFTVSTGHFKIPLIVLLFIYEFYEGSLLCFNAFSAKCERKFWIEIF